ncbi:putative myosin heavy chain [Toxoplasma gondii GAB2-2007-GAL-DOM2]|uniref:Putative myosin heavy chain n=3 Tax=Toxoplasma gondii TaxID=5811 RepID=A0A086LGQ2_TOXGO|nr:putative myosin heavy chain [Toxoplasma gondii GAB2-2007-GAL-DOM2]KFG55820.1 putative myosin heavy chain [Toxoplasma gondii FOU]PUA91899.1 putative myosin heavy chain [Toxoplasma gondii TgCATBr9]
MDADNFRKLTAILDVLDRYRKSLTAASYQSCAVDKSRGRRFSRSPSVPRSSYAGRLPSHSLFVRNSTVLKHHGDSRQMEDWPATPVSTIQRKITMRRAKTLHVRRQPPVRASCPELPELQKLQADVSELDLRLQKMITSRGMEKCFDEAVAPEDEAKRQETFEAEAVRKWSSLSDGDVFMDLDDSDDDSLRPDVVFSDSVGSVDLKSLAEMEFEEVDLNHITPKVLGQLFDRVLDCLQLDFRDLIDKLKTQNGHLKQDLISMKKKLQDAVRTNDEQVQELKDMTERVADLGAETRELTRQLRLMESQLKKYAEQDREMQAMIREKLAWEAERQQLSAQIQKLTEELGTRDDGQRVVQLLGDLDRVEALNQEREEQLKTLTKNLEAKDREIESLTFDLMKQTTMAAPRRDTRSSILSPRVSLEFLAGSLPRRSTVARRHVQSRSSLPLAGASLAGELQLATQEAEEKPAVTVEEHAQRLEDAHRKLEQALSDLHEATRVNDALRKSVSRLQRELDEKIKNLKDLAKEVENKDEQLHSAEEKLRDQSVRLDASCLKLSEAEETNRIREAELERLRADLAVARGELDVLLKQGEGDTSTNQTLVEQVNHQVEQIQKLEKEVVDLREELNASRGKNVFLSEETERLKKLLEEETGKAGEGDLAWRERLAEVEAELEAERLRALRTEELERQVKDLEEDLRVLRHMEAEMEANLKQEIEILNAHMDEQKATFSRAEKELQDQRDAAENEKADLATRLARVNEELERLHRAESLALALQAERDAFARESRSQEEAQKVRELLEKHAADLSEVRESIAELRRTKECLETEQSELERRVTAFTQEMAEVQALYQDMHSKLSAALQSKEEGRARLLAACEHMEKGVDAKLEQMRRELREESEKELERRRLVGLASSLQDSVHRLERDNAALHAKLQAAERVRDESPESQKRLEALEAENQAFSRQLADLRCVKEENDRLLRQVEDLRGRNADLEVLVATTEGAASPEVERFQQSCRRLAAQLKVLEEEAALKAQQANAEKDSLQDRCRHLETELQSASEKLRAAEQATEDWHGKYEMSTMENEKLKNKLALLTEHQGRFMEDAAEHQKLSSLMEKLSRELLQIRGDVAKIKDLGTRIQDAPSTTVFNVGYPENVIPMVSVHGDQNKEQTVNISGMYDLRMAAGQYASFSSTASSRAATPLRRNCASSLLASIRDGISNSNCCSADVESRMTSAIDSGGMTYFFPPPTRRPPATCPSPMGSSVWDKQVSKPSTILRFRTGTEAPALDSFSSKSTSSDTRSEFHPVTPGVRW